MTLHIIPSESAKRTIENRVMIVLASTHRTLLHEIAAKKVPIAPNIPNTNLEVGEFLINHKNPKRKNGVPIAILMISGIERLISKIHTPP